MKWNWNSFARSRKLFNCRRERFTSNSRSTRFRIGELERLESRVLLACEPDLEPDIAPGMYQRFDDAWVVNQSASSGAIRVCQDERSTGESALRVHFLDPDGFYYVDTNAGLAGISAAAAVTNLFLDVSIGQTLNLEGLAPIVGQQAPSSLQVAPVGFDAGSLFLDGVSTALRLDIPGNAVFIRADELDAHIGGVVSSGIHIGGGGGAVSVSGPINGAVTSIGDLDLDAGNINGSIWVVDGSLQLASSGSVFGDIEVEQGEAIIQTQGGIFGSISVAGRLDLTTLGPLDADALIADVFAQIETVGGHVNSMVARSGIEGSVTGLDRVEFLSVTDGSIAAPPGEPRLDIRVRDGIGLLRVASSNPATFPARIVANIDVDSDANQLGSLGLMIADRLDGTIRGHDIGPIQVAGGDLSALIATGTAFGMGPFDTIGTISVAGDLGVPGVEDWVLSRLGIAGISVGGNLYIGIRANYDPTDVGGNELGTLVYLTVGGILFEGEGGVLSHGPTTTTASDVAASCGGGAASCNQPPSDTCTNLMTVCAPPTEQCNDGIDNNQNGQVDEGCTDPPSENCDGVDNNQNGQVDEGCFDPPPENCDGVDNNQNGQIDEGCPTPPEQCGDGQDNDGDGLIDEGCTPPEPDLVPVEVGLSTSDVAWGETITVRNRVRNQGNAGAGASRTGYYLSLDAGIDPASDLLLHSRSVAALEPGETTPPHDSDPFITLVTMPADPPPGFQSASTVYLGVFVDDTYLVGESDENNNAAALGLTIVRLPDLVPVEVSLNRSSRDWGQRLNVRHRVHNQGDSDAGPSIVGYYMSLDATLDPADDFLLDSLAIGPVARGQSLPPDGRFNVEVTLPMEPPAGFEFASQIYVGPYVDHSFMVRESNESNNGRSVPLYVSYPDQNPRLVWFRLVEDSGISSSDAYTRNSETEGRIANLRPNTTVQYEYYNRDSGARVSGSVVPDASGYFRIPVQLSTFDPTSDPIDVTARVFRNGRYVVGAIKSLSFVLDTIEPRVAEWNPVTGAVLHHRLSSAGARLDEDGFEYGTNLGSPPTASVSSRHVNFSFVPALDNGTHAICVGPDVGDRAGNRVVTSCTTVQIVIPSYQVSVGDVSVTEPNGPAIFTVTVTPPVIANDIVRASYRTENRSAEAARDYLSAAGTLAFLPGESQQSVSVTILDDLIPESDEKFIFRLSDVSSNLGSTAGRWLAEGTIIDDDCFRVHLVQSVVVHESAGFARFEVRLYPAPLAGVEVRVDVATGDGTAIRALDYLETIQTLTFGPGETNKWFDVPILDDDLVEIDEFFWVALSNARAVSATTGLPVCVDRDGNVVTGTILDTDSFEVYLEEEDVMVPEGEAASFRVRVRPTPAAGQQVTVEFYTTDGTALVEQPDYVGVFTQVTFNPGESSAVVPVPTVDDEIIESIENFFANLRNAHATFDGLARDVTITRPTEIGWIVDDEVPPDYVATASTCSHPVESNGPAIVTVSLNPPVMGGDHVRVNYFTTNGSANAGSDFVSNSGQLQFFPHESSQSIAVTIVNDQIPELTEFFRVYLAAGVAAMGGRVTISNRETRCTIYDDDQFHLTLSPDVMIPESQSPAHFTVTVSPTPTVGQIVYVDVFTNDGTATGGSDYTPVSQLLSFGPGVGSRSVPVPIRNDSLVEIDETFFVNLTNPAAFMAGQSIAATIDRTQAKGTILDDDEYRVSANDVTVRESDCDCADFVVSLNAPVQNGQTVRVDYEIRDRTATFDLDYFTDAPLSGTIVFEPGMSEYVIDLHVRDDNWREGTETFEIVLSNARVQLDASTIEPVPIGHNPGLGTILDVEVSLILEPQHEPHTSPVQDRAAPGTTIQVDLLTGSPGQAMILPDGQMLIHSGRNATGEWLIHARGRIEGDLPPLVTEVVLKIVRDERGPGEEDDDVVTFDPVVYDTAGLAPGAEFRVAIPFDASAFLTGRYTYRLEARTAPCNVPRAFQDRTNILNDSQSSVGAGWTLSSVGRAVTTPTGVIIQEGDGTQRFFPAPVDADGNALANFTTYLRAAGDNSTVTRGVDGLRRTTPRQVVTQYDHNGRPAIITTPDDRTTVFHYIDADDDGVAAEIARITDPTGRETHYLYEGGLLRTILDFAGRTTRLEQDAARNLTRVVLPDNSFWIFRYGQEPTLEPACGCPVEAELSHRLNAVISPRNSEVLSYDHAGRVKRREIQHTFLGTILHWEDSVSVETKMLPPEGTGTEASPAPAKAIQDVDEPSTNPEVAEDRRPDPHDAPLLTQFTFDRFANPRGSLRAGQRNIYERNSNGLVTQHTDPLGHSTTFEYDDRFNTTLVTFPDSSTIASTYHPVHSGVTSVRDQNLRTTQFQYTDRGQLESLVNAKNERTFMLYGVRGVLDAVQDANNQWTLFYYDDFDRLESEHRPDGSIVHFEYDPADNLAAYFDERGFVTHSQHDVMNRWRRVEDPLDRVTTYDYDEMGNLRFAKDAANEVTETRYDALGRVSEVIGPLGPIASYSYNPAHLVSAAVSGVSPPTVYEYDALGRVVVESRPEHYTVRYAYDLGDRLQSVTDPVSGTTTFTYNNMDRLASRQNQLGQRVDYYYYPGGQLESVTDERLRTTIYRLDELNRVKEQLLPGATTPGRRYFEYDPVGNLKKVTDATGRWTTNAYDALHRLVERRDMAGNQHTWTYVAGLLDSERDANGRITQYAYNPAGQIKTVTSPAGAVTEYHYDWAGRIAEIVGPLNRTTRFEYDRESRVSRAIDPAGAATLYAYDANRRLERVTGPTGGTIRYGYDGLGRPQFIIDPAGVTTTFAYDLPNRRTSMTVGGVTTTEWFDTVGRNWRTIDAAGRLTTREFFEDGQLKSETDPNQNRTIYGYDARGRVATVTDPRGGVTRFDYDAEDRRTQVSDASGNATRYNYNAAGRLFQEIDPLGMAKTFGYDPVGNRVSITDRRGWERQFVFDADNRLTTERWYAGVSLVRSMAFTYNPAGDLLTASDPDSSYSLTYDTAGRPLTIDNLGTPLVPRVLLTNTYDPAGNRTRLDDSLGGSVTTAYDSADRPTLITQAGAGITTKQVAFTYNLQGQFASIRRAQNGTVVTQANYTYDSAGRLQQLGHVDRFGTNQTRYNLTYDPGSRIQSITMLSAAVGSKSGTFSYDSTNQLTGVTGTLYPPESYSYDLTGNRITSQSGGRSTSYSTTTGNRLASDGQFNYVYDAEGNTILRTQISNGQTTHYTWDHRNRLVSVEERTSGGAQTTYAVYTYDVFDRRIAKQATVPVAVLGPSVDQIGLYAPQSPPAPWLLDLNGQGGSPERTVSLNAGDSLSSQNYPVPGDWDGDGRVEIGLWVRTTGNWHLDLDGQGGGAEQMLDFPAYTNALWPVVGDWDSDGDDDVGLFDMVSGQWWLDKNESGPTYEETRVFGFASPTSKSRNLPVVGDWDGDGDDNLGIYDAETGTWYLDIDDLGGAAEWILHTTIVSGATPVVGDWDGDGDDNIGLYRILTGEWLLDLDDLGGAFERTLIMGGGQNYIPVVGDWDGPAILSVPQTTRAAYVYDGGHIILEYRDSGGAVGLPPTSLRTRRLYGPVTDQILAEENYSNTGSPPSALSPSHVLWPLTDWQGSVRDLVQFTQSSSLPPQASVVKHIDYDTFGRVFRVTTGTGLPSTLDSGPSTRLLYTAREYDSETSLQYNRARYYDAAIGRWLSEDPIGFAAGDANLYRSVGNSPAMAVDPSGLMEDDPKKVGGDLERLRATVRGPITDRRGIYTMPPDVRKMLIESDARDGWGEFWAQFRPWTPSRKQTLAALKSDRIGWENQQRVLRHHGNRNPMEQWHHEIVVYSTQRMLADQEKLNNVLNAASVVQIGSGLGLRGIQSIQGSVVSKTAAEIDAGILAAEARSLVKKRIVEKSGIASSTAIVGYDPGFAAWQLAQEQTPLALIAESRGKTAVVATWRLSKDTIIVGLRGTTLQAERIANAIRSGNIGVNIVGDDLFAKAWRLKGGQGTTENVVAFAAERQIFIRRSSGTYLSDAVHEGTHALDFVRSPSSFYDTPWRWESRAYFYERQYQRWTGKPHTFDTISDMQSHIRTNYLVADPKDLLESETSILTVALPEGATLEQGHFSLSGTLLVSFAAGDGADAGELRDRFQESLRVINRGLSSLGVVMVDASSLSEIADIQIEIADMSPCGTAVQGVLGCSTDNGKITIVSGWNWYVGQYPAGIDANQYDFQTILTHELGHVVGLGHSHERSSVMFGTLSRGVARRYLSTQDVIEIATNTDHKTDKSLMSKTNHESTSDSGCGCPVCRSLHEAIPCASQTEYLPVSELALHLMTGQNRAVNSIPPGSRNGPLGFVNDYGDMDADTGSFICSNIAPGDATRLKGAGIDDILFGGTGIELHIGEPGNDMLIGGIASYSQCSGGTNGASDLTEPGKNVHDQILSDLISDMYGAVRGVGGSS